MSQPKPKQRPPGKFSPERQKTITNLIRAGCTIERACNAAGIESRTLRFWRKRGKAGEEPYASFCLALKEADAMGEAHRVAVIAKAGDEDWRAAAWLLSRRHPERWGERQSIEHSGPNKSPITIDARTDLIERITRLARSPSSDEEEGEDSQELDEAAGGDP